MLTGIVKYIRRAINNFGNAFALSFYDKNLNILNGFPKNFDKRIDFKACISSINIFPSISASFIIGASFSENLESV